MLFHRLTRKPSTPAVENTARPRKKNAASRRHFQIALLRR